MVPVIPEQGKRQNCKARENNIMCMCSASSLQGTSGALAGAVGDVGKLWKHLHSSQEAAALSPLAHALY